MRIAVLIIGLCLSLAVGLQSCAVSLGGGMAKDQTISAGGALGVLVALLYLLGSAFALGLPRASVAMFLIAAPLGIGVGSSSGFHDLRIWGFVALALAAMAYLGVREQRWRKLPAGGTEVSP
ncbi:hypothetical protein [Methylobacterium sp. E-046]|uniref:hypothetical protein n=1 Tax=Methylobacterium sp. E-046 TaxID=2836576 RepID=UPI001FBA6100|nr:hypothetical protein [Methylobacterium sp. E-046]MCJ2100026.1 hypothetical protein [Methylobacterium sp. E-046]